MSYNVEAGYRLFFFLAQFADLFAKTVNRNLTSQLTHRCTRCGGRRISAASGFHLLVGRFRGRNLAVGARNIRNLIADIANHLRGLQAFLLFLFVKDRADAAVGMAAAAKAATYP